MNAMLRLNFLAVCACLVLGARNLAAETNATPPVGTNSTTQSSVSAYLQIQEELRNTQLAIEHNRQQAEAVAKRNADDMAARIEALQQIVATQRASEVEATQKTQQFTLMLAGIFGTIGLLIVLLMAFLQWRTVSRFVELSSLRAPELTMGAGRNPSSLLAGASVEQSNQRLFSMVDHLEKRIIALKQATRAPLNETASATVHEPNGTAKPASDRDERIASLLAEGESLLAANESQKALESFDAALGLDPKNADTLVKKGGALEKLDRLDEAIDCYNRAIEANGEMTIAYLHKGGLFNRLARYDEALRCYEQALRTQEKKTPEEKTAA